MVEDTLGAVFHGLVHNSPSAFASRNDNGGDWQNAHFRPSMATASPSLSGSTASGDGLTPSLHNYYRYAIFTFTSQNQYVASGKRWSPARPVVLSTVFQARHLKQRSHCTASGHVACFRQCERRLALQRPRAAHAPRLMKALRAALHAAAHRRAAPAAHAACKLCTFLFFIAASTLYRSPSRSPWTSATKQRALRVDPDRLPITPAERREQQVALERPSAFGVPLCFPQKAQSVFGYRRAG